MTHLKGYLWALCFLFLLWRPATSNVLPQDEAKEPLATEKPVMAPIFSRETSPAIRNPVPLPTELPEATVTSSPTTTPVPVTAGTSTEVPATTTTNRYRGSRIELKRPVDLMMAVKNATANANPTTTPRAEPKIQMKRPSELRPPVMGLKESLIAITDQLRRGIKTETVPVQSEIQVNKKPAAKSNQEEIIIYETSGHDGVALPLTMEDIEREMAQVEFQLQESTPKEGISTWILLSGSDTTPQPMVKGPTYMVEPEQVTEEPPKKLATDMKINKIMKVKDDKETPVLLPKRRPSTTPVPPSIKPKPRKTTTPKTTTTTTTTEAPITEATKPVKVKQDTRINGKRPRRPTTTTTTTEAPETTTPEPEEEVTEEEVVAEQPESSTFLILEAKESEFDLPADRSPTSGKKKTPVQKAKKNKKKPEKTKKKPLEEEILEQIVGGVVKKPGKSPNKNKEKPISTQIMTYLSREVMPTVGVGIVGLVAAAGLATYLLGSTFTPLRRNDRTDEIYYNNNEEYAGPDGQYEEEWFSKVIAGSPTYRNNLRQAFKGPQAQQQPNAPVPTQVQQQQAAYAVNKYPQYSKYARPPPPQYSMNPNHRNYNVRPNFAQQNYRINAGPMGGPVPGSPELLRKHSVAAPVPNYGYQQQHQPQPQEEQQQETQGYFSEASKRHSYSSGAGEILAESPQETAPSGSGMTIEDNNFLKRTSQSQQQQFVVGSVYPEAVASKESSAQVQQESVPEHGPRRRRRRGAAAGHQKKTKKLDDNELDNENELTIEELERIANVKVTKVEEEEEKKENEGTEGGVVETIKEDDHKTTVGSSSSSTTSAFAGVDEHDPHHEINSGINYYETETISSNSSSSFGDFFRRMVQLKLKLGVSFLRGMADGIARYLHQVEERLYKPQ